MVSRRVSVLLILLILVGGGAVVDATVISIDGDGVPTYSEPTEWRTSPFAADTDGDGLLDGEESPLPPGGDWGHSYLDPTDPDTDDDGLHDGRERELGTSPNAADTDGDKLDDRRELELGLPPTSTDGDGLRDDRELKLGTSPKTDDTDGDWLKDSWEVRGRAPNGLDLSESDPLHKDLYVETAILEGAEAPPKGYADWVVSEFAEMPVENPDGDTGIAVHFKHPQRRITVSVGDLHERTDSDVSYVTTEHVSQAVYNEAYMGERVNVYHLLTFVPATTDIGAREYDGLADWKVAIVSDAVFESETRTQHLVIHELLHTIVGEVGSPGCTATPDWPDQENIHTCEGYLSYSDDLFFSDRTTAWLSEHPYSNEEGELVNVTDEG